MITWKPTPRFLTTAAAVAAIYAAVTLLLAPISYGGVQLRVAEALTVLPVLSPAAIPGLFVGCLIANALGGASLLDVALGSLATLAAALCTRKLRARPLLAALPPVLFNALAVGFTLRVTANLPFGLTALTVGAGQLAACYALGLPLLWSLRQTRLLNK